MMNVDLNLREFDTHALTSLKALFNTNDFADVTLVTDDDNQFQAHKVILGFGSAFFRNILKKNQHPFPLIYLKNISKTQLEAVLKFLYLGQVQVLENQIQEFLHIAEDLKIKGLSGENCPTNKDHMEEVMKIDVKEKDDVINVHLIDIDEQPENLKTAGDVSQNEAVDESKEDDIENINKKESVANNEEKQVSDEDEGFDQDTDQSFNCKKCKYTSKWEKDIRRHYKIKHEPLNCEQCAKVLTTTQGLKHHMNTVHEGLRFPCSECPYKATNRSYLRKHFERNHSKDMIS